MESFAKSCFYQLERIVFFSASVLTLGILFLQVSFALVFAFIFIPFISPTFYFPYFSFSTTQLVDFLFLFYSIKTLIVSGIFYCCYLPVSRRETKIKSSLFHFKHELGRLMGILCNDSAVSSQTEPYRTSTKWPQCSLENTKSKIHVSFLVTVWEIKGNTYYNIPLVFAYSFWVDLSLGPQDHLKVHILSSSHVLG